LNKTDSGGKFLGKGRIETLTDGVFAIAMTLLVLDMKAPRIPAGIAQDALEFRVLDLWPKFLIYVLSFVILAIFWVGHNIQFHYISRTDRTLFWINVLFMMLIALLPFSTHLLGDHIAQQFAVIFYGCHLSLIWICLYFHWFYATTRHRLVDEDIDQRVVHAATMRILIAPILYLLAIGLSFVSTGLSISIYAIIVVMHILPGRLDRHMASPKNTWAK
jgi:uncharacterized membrane protein